MCVCVCLPLCLSIVLSNAISQLNDIHVARIQGLPFSGLATGAFITQDAADLSGVPNSVEKHDSRSSSECWTWDKAYSSALLPQYILIYLSVFLGMAYMKVW